MSPDSLRSFAHDAGALLEGDWRERARLLAEQVKQLVKSEQRLFRFQKHIDRQLKRMRAVSEFSLRATSAFEPRQILTLAADMLLDVLAFDQAVGLVALDSRELSPIAFRARIGLDPALIASHGPIACDAFDELGGERRVLILGGELVSAALAEVFDARFGPVRNGGGALWVVLPLQGQRVRGNLGLLALRLLQPQQATLHDGLPDESDLPFLELVMRHLECNLENAVLHARLSNVAASLERRVAERTEALSALNLQLSNSLSELRSTQDQLIQASKMAAVGTLIAGLSHELNTPLGIILGYATSLSRVVDGSSALRPGIDAIERQAERCKHLVASLLGFARRSPSSRERVAAASLIERVHAFTVASARRETIELRIEVQPELPNLVVNPTEIESALLNLVNNALDAVGEQGEVELSVHRASTAAAGVEFTVRDNGHGIAADALPWIFDPFFTTKGPGKGTGLGLAVARRIVEAHHGSLEVESTLGKGTLMRLWLPAA